MRDKIPGIIRDAGSDCRVHSVRESELTYYLAKKMQEEITEFIKDPSVEEAADIYEVFLTLLRTWNIDMPDVIFKAEDKRQSRGGFTQGIILDEVSKN